MEWMWTTQSETEQLSLISSLSRTGIIDRSLQQTALLFNVTDLSPTYINVLATVSDPISLNGTQMDCNGQTLTIDIRFISKCLYQRVLGLLIRTILTCCSISMNTWIRYQNSTHANAS